MSDLVIWIIVIAFYAPLHFMLPVLFLFITGKESEELRRQLIRSVLRDALTSMVLAIGLAVLLVQLGWMMPAMLILMLSMTLPFLRIYRSRRVLAGE
jgi:hypothetical protein